jgi:hypothetical protein
VFKVSVYLQIPESVPTSVDVLCIRGIQKLVL